MSDKFDELRKAWKDASVNNEGHYVASADVKKIDNLRKKLGLMTNLLPHPWWGNIDNPDVLVLAKNPGYSPFVDEVEELLYHNIVKSSLDDPSKPLYWNSFKYNETIETQKLQIKLPGTDTMKNKSTQGWWNTCCSNYLNPEKTAFFNLLGYRSKSFKDNESIYELPTVKATCEYVDYLTKINENNKDFKIIIVWGANEWLGAMKQNHCNALQEKMKKEENYIVPKVDTKYEYAYLSDNILVVNSFNPQNKIIQNFLSEKLVSIKNYVEIKKRFDSFIEKLIKIKEATKAN